MIDWPLIIPLIILFEVSLVAQVTSWRSRHIEGIQMLVEFTIQRPLKFADIACSIKS
jgi:hypothetical protein